MMIEFGVVIATDKFFFSEIDITEKWLCHLLFQLRVLFKISEQN